MEVEGIGSLMGHLRSGVVVLTTDCIMKLSGCDHRCRCRRVVCRVGATTRRKCGCGMDAKCSVARSTPMRSWHSLALDAPAAVGVQGCRVDHGSGASTQARRSAPGGPRPIWSPVGPGWTRLLVTKSGWKCSTLTVAILGCVIERWAPSCERSMEVKEGRVYMGAISIPSLEFPGLVMYSR